MHQNFQGSCHHIPPLCLPVKKKTSGLPLVEVQLCLKQAIIYQLFYVLHTVSQSSFFWFSFVLVCVLHIIRVFFFFIVNPQASEKSWGRSYFGRKQFAKFRSQWRRSKSKVFMLKSCVMLTKIPKATSICSKKKLNMLSSGQKCFLNV